ncbi:phage tail protein [Citrobacter youngae]|nr:phage tail protein [Citrobacter youngae]
MALSLLAANNAQTVLAAGISSTATSLTVNAGTGTLFPSPVAGTSFFKLTIIDAATGSLTEIIHVTARNGDVFTIQRGQEGTVPRAWSANDIAANMMTAGTLSYILGNFQPLDPTLTALATLVGAANKLPYFNGDDTAALTDLTQVGRDIIGKNTIADILTYLGLGAGAPPIGIPFYWPLAAMPNTVMPEWSDMVFLKPNGASFSAATYPKLALVWPGLIIPEMRGEFIRIFDDGRGVNPVQPLLGWADSRLKEHTHVLPTGRMAVGVDDVSSTWVVVENDVATPKVSTKTQSGGAGETAPRSIAFNCLVRAK